ncbi:GMC oxidoreductase [Macroventuria anomochaeta]|uniref:GMC oxidoreductase n=1 Tax=Macroventuria anomochaeta TaxID=301207 RepID=A0ACB6S5W1_9PLEO|nr:GMC oxidoreductase [Macroventuria anomochaeta]KAF2628599.1 GMC oxidoreductase [Macroventuria anomochaeta]
MSSRLPVSRSRRISLLSVSTYRITLTPKLFFSTDHLPPVYKNNPNLLRGYEAAKTITAELLSGTKAAAVEVLMNAFGLAISAVQRPLSRGYNPADKTMMIEAGKWTRRYWQNPVLARFSPVEVTPGVAAQTDKETVHALLKQDALTIIFAHQSGTCSMLPDKYGGCVRSDLRVYGTKKLSIVDASIIPLVPATHMQATMYAVAEKAADIIKLRNIFWRSVKKMV